MSEQKQFHIVGYAEVAFSGRSLKITLTRAAESFYISLKSIDEVKSGKKKSATAYILEAKETEGNH